ncbi:MAG: hypothetical protein K2Y37_20750 [Pirellulales bacterium]|nr:hypothetical protein [Pirellulales bacterium]
MDARHLRVAVAALAVTLLGASHRTPNFVVRAPSEDFARHVGEAAETYRRELAVRWIGKELPRWASPCPITLQVGPHLGAGGATSFVFDHGEVFNWQMQIQGTPERIVDSVLPHEITHTIFASHFRRPLPRWADEGACTTVEHNSERGKMSRMLIDFLQTGRGIAFNELFVMRDYPSDVMPLYSQGYSLCRFLIEQGGPRKFVEFLGAGMNGDRWTEAVKSHYGFASLGQLQAAWLDWVRQGSPALENNSTPAEPDMILASATGPAKSPSAAAATNSPQPEPIYRAQSADTPVPTDATLATATIAAAAAPATPTASTVAAGPIPPTVGPQAIAAAPTDAQPSRWRSAAAMPQTASASASRGDSTRWRSSDRRAEEPAAAPGPVAAVESHEPPESSTTVAEPAPRRATTSSAAADKSPQRRVLLEWTRPTAPGQRVAANRPISTTPFEMREQDRGAEAENGTRPIYFDAPLRRTLLR